MVVLLQRHHVFRFESDDLAIAPDHGVLTETTLAFERFGNGAAQRIQRLLTRDGHVFHAFVAFMS